MKRSESTAKYTADTADDASMSASRRVYQQLRHRIVTMVMLPGERVSEKLIADELGISRTPVHEAVQRLAEEGLIEIVPRSGTFVARIPLDTLEETMLVRTALELAIIVKAAERATTEGISRLRKILKTQAACIKANDKKGFHQTDEDFHATLVELSGFTGVWPMILQAKTQIDRYRQLTLPVPGRMHDVLTEHQRVFAAVEARDPEMARQAMQNHLDHVLPLLEETRQIQPDYFVPGSGRAKR
ncbi:MAG TPA: GntR family transcriptional regulator [Burkholderiaceae bacterium]|jgi:DNA-binding GntR family transcriptional regulator|nr:GntR family transcriptional regulator [Burkholderiaceae bacterium]